MGNGTLEVPNSGVAELATPVGKVYSPKWTEDLFRAGEPSMDNVQQGGIGSCLGLGAIMAVVQHPRGQEYIKGMMYDQYILGQRPEPDHDHPVWVVVRLYDTNRTAHYVKVKKRIVLNSFAGGEAFAHGALWVSILEQAFMALNFDGNFDPAGADFSRLEGLRYSALKAILGVEVHNHNIPDLSFAKERLDTYREWSSAQDNPSNQMVYGGNQVLFFGKLLKADMALADQQQRMRHELLPVFGSDPDMLETFLKWGIFKPRGSNKTRLNTFRDLTQNKMIRVEDVERFFSDNYLDNATKSQILNWLRANNVVPGNRGTDTYSKVDEWVFTELQNACLNHMPCVISTRRNIGKPEGVGHSAGEPMVRGLVANHAYPVIGAENTGATKYVRIRNPWANYGREYALAFDGKHGDKMKAFAKESAVSVLHLEDVARRFSTIEIASICLV